MGYNTKFSGSLKLSRKLTIAEAKMFLEANEDPEQIKGDKPGSYMQWVPSESLESIVYDGNEKFYHYDEWMQWVLTKLGDMGIVANGSIAWSGESAGDLGVLIVENNTLTVSKNKAGSNNPEKPLTLDGLGKIALEMVTA